jgi:hypothetical protein
MRDRERTPTRQKRREVRAKVGPRGGSFPGTAERPLRRRQVFSGALRRLNREIGRIRKLEPRAALTEPGRISSPPATTVVDVPKITGLPREVRDHG